MAEKRDYPAIGYQYAEDVVAGRIPACKWTVAACLRELDDAARADTPAFPFRHNADAGIRVCRSLELLPHIKGRWPARTIRLEPWQIFIQMTLFSWVHSTKLSEDPALVARDGLRRFRTDYEEVPRKNAKSTISAGRGLYMLGPDGEQGAECYSAATTRDQAKIVWSVAHAMARKTPEYCDRFGVDVLAHSLTVPETDSFFRALSADDDSLDGLNPHYANVDELHAHKTRGVWDVLETATGSRDQSLLSTITTAGSNRAGVCYEVRTYLTKILNAVLLRHPELCESRGYAVDGGATDDETFYGIIYTIDDGDEWDDPAAWAKANPNLGVSVKRDDIARLCAKAQQTPSAQPNFKTKRLNVWINADSAWMDMLKWHAAADVKLSIDDFAGQDVFVGISMEEVSGIAPIVYLFARSIEETNKAGEPEAHTHYYAFARFFIPEDEIEDADDRQYAAWEESNRLIATDGNVTDQNAMQDELREAQKSYTIREVAYAPAQATKFATELLTEGFVMVELPQTTRQYSAPMKYIEGLVRTGRFHHDGDPVMTWMISNTVAHVDRHNNYFPTRQTSANKIEGPKALIAAMARAMHAPPPETSIYDREGISFL